MKSAEWQRTQNALRKLLNRRVTQAEVKAVMDLKKDVGEL